MLNHMMKLRPRSHVVSVLDCTSTFTDLHISQTPQAKTYRTLDEGSEAGAVQGVDDWITSHIQIVNL